MYIYYDWLVKVAPLYPICKFPASFCTPMENAWPEGEISWEEGLLFYIYWFVWSVLIMEGAFRVK